MIKNDLIKYRNKCWKPFVATLVLFFMSVLTTIMNGPKFISTFLFYACVLTWLISFFWAIKFVYYGNKEVIRRIKNNEFPLPDLYSDDEKDDIK